MPRLTLLGGVVLAAEDGPVEGPAARRHPLALLALLACASARTLRRGKIVGYLWPETAERRARSRLSTHIHQIRRELGDDVLVSVGGDLRLDETALTSDVWEFEEALERESFEEAVELYRGSFLDGFRLKGSPAFEKWTDRQRSRLRRAYREALEALAEAATARGEPDDAVRWWRRRVEEDPYDSRATLRLVEALEAVGNRPEALRAARDHSQLLEEELGIQPDAEFRALVERLREGDDGRRAAATAGEGAPDDLSVRAVAVLPFENLSGTDEAEPFAAGLHDDLITELSRISDLTVISRTSVVRYRNTERPVREIGRELGVGTLVEGGVQQMGRRVRLNVQLIDARQDAHLWGERYDRELTSEDLFDLQGELAVRIAETLRATLTAEEERRLGRAPTADLDAYRLCVQGRGLLDQRTGDSMRRAMDYFRNTLELDPAYALAWSGLADALALLDFYGHTVPDDAPDAMEAARRAVELDPGSGEAHASLGIQHSLRQEGPEALRELERARELAPSYAETYVWLAWVHLLRGDAAVALSPGKRAVELNPLAPAFRVYHSEALLAAGKSEEALDEARRARDLQPDYPLPPFLEGLTLHHMGRPRDAASALETALSLTRPRGTPSHPEARAALAVTRAAAGEPAKTRDLLEQIEDERDLPGGTFSVGLVRAALGDVDGAFRAFREVRTWDDFSVDHVRHFFPEVLGPLREDPRWERLLHRIDRSWGWDRDEAFRSPAGNGSRHDRIEATDEG